MDQKLYAKLKRMADERHGTTVHVRLKTMAKFINDNFPDYEAVMENWLGSFDRSVRGRLRDPGRLIEGKILCVYNKGERDRDNRVLLHNPYEAYRQNWEVAEWIVEEMKKKGGK